MSFRVLGTHHTSFTVSDIDRGPNRGRQVVYLRDRDGVTMELIEVKNT